MNALFDTCILPETQSSTRQFLHRFRLIEIDTTVREEAVIIRRVHQIKPPDAIIWASTKIHGFTLITRNTKDFSETLPGIHIPEAGLID